MKKGFAILLILAMLAFCAGCQSTKVKSDDHQTIDIQFYGQTIPWNAQYIRTNGGFEASGAYPSVKIIYSAQELNEYYNTWHEIFDLERKEKVYSDTTMGF